MSASLSRDELDVLDLSSVQWTDAPDVTTGDEVEIAHLSGGAVAMRGKADPDTVVRYTAEEWNAFVLGVRDGEFDLS